MSEKGSESSKPTGGFSEEKSISRGKAIPIESLPFFKKFGKRTWKDVSPDFWKRAGIGWGNIDENFWEKEQPDIGMVTNREDVPCLQQVADTVSQARNESNENTTSPHGAFLDPLTSSIFMPRDAFSTYTLESNTQIPSLESQLFSEGGRIGEFEITQKIGQGGMGGVYLLSKEGRRYILKIPLMVGIQKTCLENEINILAYVQEQIKKRKLTGALTADPNIIRLHMHSSGYLSYAILELLENTPAFKKANPTKKPSERMVYVAQKDTLQGQQPVRVAKYMWDIANSLEFLHSIDVVHGDIKHQNCMDAHRNGKLEFILFDFGLSKIVDEAHEQELRDSKIGFTLQYTPKGYIEELLKWGDGFFQKCPLPKLKMVLEKNDWSGLALSAYHLLTDVLPYSYTKKPRKDGRYINVFDGVCSPDDEIRRVLDFSEGAIDYGLVKDRQYGDVFAKAFRLLQEPFILSKEGLNQFYGTIRRGINIPGLFE